MPKIESVESLRPLGPIAVAVLLYPACDLPIANQFLAAFVAGAALATLQPAVSESFQHAGELISEVAKARRHPADRPPADLVLGTSLDRRLAVAWFGPQGCAGAA